MNQAHEFRIHFHAFVSLCHEAGLNEKEHDIYVAAHKWARFIITEDLKKFVVSPLSF